MSFIRYKARKGREGRDYFPFPTITFYNGKIGRFKAHINRLAQKDFLPPHSRVKLFYDPDEEKVGIQVTQTGSGLKVSSIGNCCAVISFDGFVRQFGIDPCDLERKWFKLDQEGDFITFDMKEPLKDEAKRECWKNERK